MSESTYVLKKKVLERMCYIAMCRPACLYIMYGGNSANATRRSAVVVGVLYVQILHDSVVYNVFLFTGYFYDFFLFLCEGLKSEFVCLLWNYFFFMYVLSVCCLRHVFFF